MSAIPPPNWLGSILGAGGAQQRAADAKRAEHAQEAHAVDAASFARKLGEAISTEDLDMDVYADAEGAGGQGRSAGQHHEQHAEESSPPPPPVENDCGGTLDVSA